MHRRDFLASAALAASAGLARASHAQGYSDPPNRPSGTPRTVPASRLALLAAGVNLSHWLWLPKEQNADDRWKFIKREELDALRAAGLSHVRLPLDPASLWDREAKALRPGAWGEAQYAIDLCLAANLAVVLDIHPRGGQSKWIMPDDATGATQHLEALWTALAPRCTQWDAEKVFLEIMNEPHEIKEPGAWAIAQQRVASIIRDHCPNHTIIATGDEWGGVGGLKKLDPLDDGNVVYSFHFYEPMTFTHQGATWGWEGWKNLRNVPYPCTTQQAKDVAKTIDDEKGRKGLIGEHSDKEEAKQKFDGWNRDHIAARIDEAAAWSRHNARKGEALPLYCGEFGAIKEFAPQESRLAWLKDVAAVCREKKIGWAMWDYCGGFAMSEEKDGKKALDAQVLRAALKR
ncbi:MAG: cellulase family glycosylhydrolase [Phycisphaerales bacterium]